MHNLQFLAWRKAPATAQTTQTLCTSFLNGTCEGKILRRILKVCFQTKIKIRKAVFNRLTQNSRQW